MDGAYKDMKEYLAKGAKMPTAFFADDDMIALGCIKAFQEAGYRVTEDSSRLSENTEDPRKFNIPWVFSFCQNLRICV